MKHSYIFGFCLLIFGLISFSSGPGSTANFAVAGAPGETQTCSASSCHVGNAFGQITFIDIKDANGNDVEEYIPDAEYDVTVNIIANTGTPGGYGFQMVALLDNATQDDVDGWGTPSAGMSIVNVLNRNYVEHSSPSTNNTFSIKWTAPSAGSGNVDFFAAGNAVNRTGNASGDDVALTSFSLTESLTSPTEELQVAPNTVSLYPNPTSDILTISLQDKSFEGTLKLIDVIGNEIFTSDITNGYKVLNIDDFNPGIYLLSVFDDYNTRIVTRKVVKK